MDAANTNLDKHRQTSIAQELRFPCGGPQGTAMSLTADENMSWLHGTYLDFESCQYALRASFSDCVTCHGLTHIERGRYRTMVQITCHVLHGKANDVMRIWRREVLGDDVRHNGEE